MFLVAVAQWLEREVVDLEVARSNRVSHPKGRLIKWQRKINLNVRDS